ncbi:MAG: hypothetical protein MUC50_15435 [Myxococcota bacterium]|nr:hypothetical protein [Myxococcota bacterium]
MRNRPLLEGRGCSESPGAAATERGPPDVAAAEASCCRVTADPGSIGPGVAAGRGRRELASDHAAPFRGLPGRFGVTAQQLAERSRGYFRRHHPCGGSRCSP